MAEYANRKPNIAPPIEVTRLILMLIQYALRTYWSEKSARIFLKVKAWVVES